MYKVIYMKADYEPWWQFEGWEEYIVKEQSFDNKFEAERYLKQMLYTFSERYEHQEHRKDRFWAFWSDDEMDFCEACDDDIQTFHGIIWQQDEVNIV
ncbi:DUF1033 family protein [Kurthia massiliensis]|uniref:DUF1033 family protein n=1 Tax=Kurthia massiliensis TaxID=1033739 RepID=UPI00164D0A8D|nr:DUF1033 family protein [Kurthia massiliensis]